MQNKGIQNKLDAWLTFLSSDNPEDIFTILERYPEFQAMYEHVFDICRNIERVMGMFSEELRILDRNTVRIMLDDMQDTIDEQKAIIEQKDRELAEARKLIEELKKNT